MIVKYFLYLSQILTFFTITYGVFPLEFCIPEVKIVKEIPKKDRDFAPLIPGNKNTYIYNDENTYYQDYQRSYFAITCKKGGWDCERHYEILANGCIPYFIDLDKCDSNTMFLLPRKLIHEAMNLKGVSYFKIDHKKFDTKKYYKILNELLDYTRNYLTTRSMAQYLLKSINYSGNGPILFLSKDLYPDYMRCLTLIGLKEVLGPRVVDVPKIPHIYNSYPEEQTKTLYGKGFSYSRILDDLPVNRDDIEQRIKNREFDLIIYGSVHRGYGFAHGSRNSDGCDYADLINKYYSQQQIVYLCGEDEHICCFAKNYPLFFLREFEHN